MAGNTLKINAKSVLKYSLLPGIIPRAKELGTSGFGYLAFLFASVYRAVRILPPGHPYADPANIGKFSIINVIAAAANNIEIRRGNIDQIIVFAALLVAVILMFLQFILLILGLFTGNAFASAGGGQAFENIFTTQYPANDIAFLMLDYVFGIPAFGSAGQQGPNAGFFGSMAIAAGPTPFHEGMHALFHFYNLAILLVAVLIFMYFIIVVVVETAQTGVPFGKRFSKIYAPFRLVFAVGLLVPLYNGYNGAQYITLTAAKMGSSFATNGWILYNRELTNPIGVENASLIAQPKVPTFQKILEFSSVYHACRDMYGQYVPKKFDKPQERTVCIKPYAIINGAAQEFVSSECTGKSAGGDRTSASMDQYADRGMRDGSTSGDLPYETAKQALADNKGSKKNFGAGDLEIVLGEYDPKENANYAGSVRPYCGKLTISMVNNNPRIYTNASATNDTTASRASGILAIEKMYYGTIQQMLRKNDGSGAGSPAFVAMGERMSRAELPVTKAQGQDPCWRSSDLKDGETCENGFTPPVSVFDTVVTTYDNAHKVLLNAYYETYRKSLNLKLSEELERRGWGGAGIWYNNIADLNGTFTGATYATPSVREFPQVMEYVKQERQNQDKSVTPCEIFNVNLGDNKEVKFQNSHERVIAYALNATYKYFNCDAPKIRAGGQSAEGGGNANVPAKSVSSNVIIQAIGNIFGINGLFDMRTASEVNKKTGLAPVHPLAQLSTIGKSLVENAIRSMAMAVGTAFGGGIMGALGTGLGPSLGALSGMFTGIATLGLTAGFILYYILPFLPFIYFFFAVGSWVKSIFEAMVGVPLWALAHLRIDGDGFPGRAAMGGYWLIFEIFLRPIVTLFGLIGGIAIFGAATSTLNTLFDLIISNITGVALDDNGKVVESAATMGAGSIEGFRRGVIDQFFFTIMYAILVYMMATASFKMIDMVPRSIMRWMGTGVSTFNDNKGDVVGNLTSYAAVGGSQVSGQIFGGITQGAGAAGGLLGTVAKTATDDGKQQQT